MAIMTGTAATTMMIAQVTIADGQHRAKCRRPIAGGDLRNDSFDPYPAAQPAIFDPRKPSSIQECTEPWEWPFSITLDVALA